MAISFTRKATLSDSADRSAYPTASWTPAANKTHLAAVIQRSDSSVIPTLSGNGLTWDQVNSVEHGGVIRVTVFRAEGVASPSAGATTATFSVGMAGCIILIDEVTDGEVPTPFHSGIFADNGTTTAVVSMSSVDAGSAIWFGGGSNQNGATTPEASYTAPAAATLQSGPAMSGLTAYDADGGDTTPSFSIPANSRVLIVAVEVKAPSGGASPITLTPDPVSTSPAVPAAALALGTLALAPAPVALGLAITTPGLGLSLALAPSPVSLVLAVPSPALARLLSLSPSPVALSLAVPAAIVSESGIPIMLSPDPVALSLGLAAPSLALSLTLAPAAVPVTPAIPTISLGLSFILAPEPVAVSTTVPITLIDMGAVPIHLAPAPVAVTLALTSPTLAQILQLAPAAVAVPLTVTATDLGLGPLVLLPSPVALSLLVPEAEVIGPISSGSDIAFIQDCIAYFVALDAATSDSQRRVLHRRFLLEHGGQLRQEKWHRRLIVVGGLEPVRF